jgi:hypothetical protein
LSPARKHASALRPARRGEPRALGLGAGRLLVLLAEWERQTRQVPRIERGEHVALVLDRIGAAGEQKPSLPLDDARVVARHQVLGAGAPRERQQLGEAEAAVAARARIRRLAARIAAHERRHDRAPELLAEVERHVRHAEAVARLARRDHALGRAAGALGVRPLRIEPEAKRHTHRVRQGAQERDRAVHAAAHRHRDPARTRPRAEGRPERVRKRIHDQGLAPDCRRLEEGQAREVALEARRVRLDDPLTVDHQADRRPFAGAARVSEGLVHRRHGR